MPSHTSDAASAVTGSRENTSAAHSSRLKNRSPFFIFDPPYIDLIIGSFHLAVFSSPVHLIGTTAMI
ncbi:MAG: hypothetical protein VB106_09340 [Clostridiaceae bacterium]|nr:hypothetical protein [Clostridiaceae bacterium]